MKFGKRMRSLATPAWSEDYVDYKQLKQLIKSLEAQQQDEQVSVIFHTALEREMVRLNTAHERILSELQHKELRALRSALGNRWVLSPSQARSLLLGAIELSEKIDAFRRFIVLNSLAIIKSTKKFDKVCDQELKDVVLEELQCQSFYDGSSLDHLCVAASQLTDRIMLCVLPDGNFRMSQHQVSCPICFHTEVKSPITLSCGHTFCWSCLSKAKEHHFHACPLCRKDQSIDPRDYAVDGLLQRFKRAYDFIETDALLDRAPLSSSPMRQILIEAFELVNVYLREIQSRYAALTPVASRAGSPAPFAKNDEELLTIPDKNVAVSSPTTFDQAVQELTTDVPPCFEKNDAVEVHYNGHWYPGMILHLNEDSATYSVLWWMEDGSQRCGQRMPRHLLREPECPEQTHYMLYDFAAGVWKTATEWALSPLRRLRKLSLSSDTNTLTTV